MKYTCELDINLPLDRVIELFDNPDNLSKWQPGLLSYKPVLDEHGQTGPQMELIYQMGKRNIRMVETILERNLPELMSGTYEANGVWNKVDNVFVENMDGTTTWTTHQEYVFNNLLMKIFAWIMPRSFKTQSLAFMENFKKFAERQ